MSTTAEQVRIPIRGHMLGIRTNDRLKVIRKLQTGLPYRAYQQFLDKSGLRPESVVRVIGTAVRTLARRREQGRLSRSESERLLRLAIIYEDALELFEGDAAATRKWLETPQKAFGGLTPLTMAESELGAREVEDLIGRLEHGVFS